jgi:hypothetical protein
MLMKLIVMGIAGLIGLSGCGGEIIVGDASGGSPGAGAPGAAGNPGVLGAQGGASGGFSVLADCSASPDSYETYSTPEELNELLIGQWRRCVEPQIEGEDIGVEFTEDGRIYPLTTDDTQQVVRRTGVDYEKTWAYSAPGSEDPISHEPSRDGFMVLDGVITSVPQFTIGPRQLRILFSPVASKYVPLLP